MCFTKKVQCDNWSLACLTVRHTPPLRGTPLREGMAQRRSIDNQRNAVAHPLSERGEGTACGRSDSEAVNKSEGRGVSHNHYKDIVFCRKVIIKTSFFCRKVIIMTSFFLS